MCVSARAKLSSFFRFHPPPDRQTKKDERMKVRANLATPRMKKDESKNCFHSRMKKGWKPPLKKKDKKNFKAEDKNFNAEDKKFLTQRIKNLTMDKKF